MEFAIDELSAVGPLTPALSPEGAREFTFGENDIIGGIMAEFHICTRGMSAILLR